MEEIKDDAGAVYISSNYLSSQLFYRCTKIWNGTLKNCPMILNLIW